MFAHATVGQFAGMPAADASRVDVEIGRQATIVYQMLHDAMRCWRAADVSQADEKEPLLCFIHKYCFKLNGVSTHCQSAYYLLYRLAAMPVKPKIDALAHLDRHLRIDEICRPNLNGGRTCHQKFDGILSRADSS